MPTLLKQRTSHSPGIITFTHAEALWGLPRRSKRVRDYLSETSNSGRWLFGVHVQGDCSHLKDWPLADWHSFVMWPDRQASFLHNLPADKFCPLTCINFMPAFLAARKTVEKEWDLCIISRASTIKRIEETLRTLRVLFDSRPDLNVVLVVPDPRKIELGAKSYEVQRIHKSYFTLPRKLFSSRELKNISFISSSQESFGTFPLSDLMIADILAKSRFMMLTSYLEGVPRVIAEALLVGTPCIVSRALKSGLNHVLDAHNALKIAADPAVAAAEILGALESYGQFSVERAAARDMFSESEHLPALKTYLSDKIAAAGFPVEGKWYLDDLHLRLACHGQKHNLQFFYRENLFFDWLERAESITTDYVDEDFVAGADVIFDEPTLLEETKQALAASAAYRFLVPLKKLAGK